VLVCPKPLRPYDFGLEQSCEKSFRQPVTGSIYSDGKLAPSASETIPLRYSAVSVQTGGRMGGGYVGVRATIYVRLRERRAGAPVLKKHAAAKGKHY